MRTFTAAASVHYLIIALFSMPERHDRSLLCTYSETGCLSRSSRLCLSSQQPEHSHNMTLMIRLYEHTAMRADEMQVFHQSSEDGAISTLRASTDPSLTGQGFKYFGPWYKGPLQMHVGNESKWRIYCLFLLALDVQLPVNSIWLTP